MGRVWEAFQKRQTEEPEKVPSEQATIPKDLDTSERVEERLVIRPDGNNYSAVLMAHHDRGGRIAEQYRALRTNLLAKYADERFSCIITSAEVGEGKTVTCLNLALVLAERQERRVVVVDGDLRKGAIASLLQAKKSPGMADLLRGAAALSEVIQPTAYPNLFLIPAGQSRQDEVGELIGRPELDEVTNELRRQYDCVLFDAPPVNPVSDASILGRAVGEALLVVRMNKTPRERIDTAIGLLHAANVKIAGMLLSHEQYDISSYSYQYRYHYS